MKTQIMKTSLAIISLIFATFITHAQNSKKETVNPELNNIQVIQFHSEHRCYTCKLIEKLTRETLQAHFPNVPFKLINVDDSKNAKIAEEFEATGTALFIYNPKTGKKKDLTDFAFMNAKSKPEEFKKGLIKEINNFK